MYLPSSAPVRAFKAAIIAAARERVRNPFPGGVVVGITAVFRRPPSHMTARGELRMGVADHPGKNLGDVDNIAKGVMDALTDAGIVWADDSQVVELRVSKAWGDADLTEVTIEEVPYGRSR
jgi:Holliday junction resolvase RusA-like endonuclease